MCLCNNIIFNFKLKWKFFSFQNANLVKILVFICIFFPYNFPDWWIYIYISVSNLSFCVMKIEKWLKNLILSTFIIQNEGRSIPRYICIET